MPTKLTVVVMSVRFEHLTRIVASSGLIRLEESELSGVYKLMRTGNVDSYLGHLRVDELRDLVSVASELVTFLDTGQSLEEAS